MREPLLVPPHLADGVGGCLCWATLPPQPPKRLHSACRPDRDINIFRCSSADLRLRDEREKQPVNSVRTRGFHNAFVPAAAAVVAQEQPAAAPQSERRHRRTQRKLWPWQRQEQLNLFRDNTVSRGERRRVRKRQPRVAHPPSLSRHYAAPITHAAAAAAHPMENKKVPVRPATAPSSRRVKHKIAEIARRFLEQPLN